MIFVFELSQLAGKMTKQINVKTFIHKVSSGNRGVDPPGPMPNPAVKHSIAGGYCGGYPWDGQGAKRPVLPFVRVG